MVFSKSNCPALKGKYVSSSDLVPGDVYELSDPNLTQFPSDSLLLSGDCIVNESMLTGLSYIPGGIWRKYR